MRSWRGPGAQAGVDPRAPAQSRDQEEATESRRARRYMARRAGGASTSGRCRSNHGRDGWRCREQRSSAHPREPFPSFLAAAARQPNPRERSRRYRPHRARLTIPRPVARSASAGEAGSRGGPEKVTRRARSASTSGRRRSSHGRDGWRCREHRFSAPPREPFPSFLAAAARQPNPRERSRRYRPHRARLTIPRPRRAARSGHGAAPPDSRAA